MTHAEPKKNRPHVGLGERRSAARLAAVQALYQMDLTGKGLDAIIREFERHLGDSGTKVVKIFLHISKDEQKARLLARLGFTNLRVVGDRIGQASSIKMIRSVMVKGIEALTAECMLAAQAAGVAEEVLASLDASDKAVPWARNRAARRSTIDSQSICGGACTWQRNPSSAYSGAATTPDFASRSDASTSLVLLPMEETIPIPVTTTRRMSGPQALCERPTLRSDAV